MPTALIRIIGKTRRRLRYQRGLEALTTLGLVWTLAAMILICLLKARIMTGLHFWQGIVSAGVIWGLAAVGNALRHISPLYVARRIDTSHALHDRIGTALEFCALKERTDFMRAQIQDAIQHVLSVSPKRAAPLRWPKNTRPLALLLLCLAAVCHLRFPPPPHPTEKKIFLPKLSLDGDELEPERALIHELQKEAVTQLQPEMNELAQALNKLFGQIQQKELTQKEIFAKLAALEKKYIKGLEGNFDELLQKLKKVGGELQREKLTKDLGHALKESDLDQAKKELDTLAQRLEQMKDQDKKRLATALAQAAQQKDQDRLQKKIADLEQHLRRLKRQIQQQEKNPEARRRMEKTQRQLQRLSQQMPHVAQPQRQLQRLNQKLSDLEYQARRKATLKEFHIYDPIDNPHPYDD